MVRPNSLIQCSSLPFREETIDIILQIIEASVAGFEASGDHDILTRQDGTDTDAVASVGRLRCTVSSLVGVGEVECRKGVNVALMSGMAEPLVAERRVILKVVQSSLARMRIVLPLVLLDVERGMRRSSRSESVAPL